MTDMSGDGPLMEGDNEEFTFNTMMKKKKKKRTPLVSEKMEGSSDLAQSEAATAEGEQTPAAGAEETAKIVEGEEGWKLSDRDYTYSELLTRVFGILRQNNPDLAGDRRKFTMIPPDIGREGSKKTAFANIAEISRRMRRPVEHVTQFLLTELGTTGNMDGAQRLIIKGRFQQLQMENLLRRYIQEYVTCKTCRSPETQLMKENRLFFMKCESCESSRSVTTIKAGFKAQTGRRVRAA